MFDGLKKKLSEAVKIFAKKEEKEVLGGQKQAVEEKGQAAEEEREAGVAEPEQVEKQHRQEHKAEKEKEKEKEREKGREKEKEELVRLSLKTKLKGVFVSNVTLSESEIDGFLENLKISMLQSDVSFETTEAFLEDLKKNLLESRLDAKNIQGDLVAAVRKSLFDILDRSGKGVDIKSFARERVQTGNTPVKILFLGPNGTGKTTTIAKIAYALKKDGISSVMSASDTFRAAAIEQTEHHANKVGVPVIKSKYGADPASIAFDAIAYAKAHNIQTVLIDSAGRQETNKNLIKEMEKMVRIAQPDLTIFVGESTTGNQLSEQVREFAKFMKIDGIILTKLDVDAKGGNAISIAYTTGIPLLYLGTGESYEALVPYTTAFIVNSILPNN